MNVLEVVLRIRYAYGRSRREIGSACGLSVGVVNGLLQRADLAGLGWPLPTGLNADGLREWVYGKPSGRRPDARREALDFAAMDKELNRRRSPSYGGITARRPRTCTGSASTASRTGNGRRGGRR